MMSLILCGIQAIRMNQELNLFEPFKSKIQFCIRIKRLSPHKQHEYENLDKKTRLARDKDVGFIYVTDTQFPTCFLCLLAIS